MSLALCHFFDEANSFFTIKTTILTRETQNTFQIKTYNFVSSPITSKFITLQVGATRVKLLYSHSLLNTKYYMCDKRSAASVIALKMQKVDCLYTIMGKTIAALEVLMTQSRTKQLSWMMVKRCTFLRGTWRRQMKSGWCLAGMPNSRRRSKNWRQYRIKDLYLYVQNTFRRSTFLF